MLTTFPLAGDCRFCQNDVEEEYRTFLVCDSSDELLEVRRHTVSSLFDADPALRCMHVTHPHAFLGAALHRLDTVELVSIRVIPFLRQGLFTSLMVLFTIPLSIGYRDSESQPSIVKLCLQ